VRPAVLVCALLALSCGNVARIAGGDVRLEDVSTAAAVAKTITDMNKDLTPENEYWVGRSVATNILAKHDYRYRDADAIRGGNLTGVTAYVNKVGAVLAAAALETGRKGDRPAPIAGFHFTVVESDTINAFAAPGGYVFVTTAALKAAKSEDELAAILAHELAHVVRGHALGTIKKSRYANMSKDLLKASGALSPEQIGQLTVLLEGAIDDMIDAFFVKGYSKDTEYEADAVGLAIMQQAGYDGSAFIRYLETLKARQKTGSGGFYATHPAAADRIAKLGKKATKGKVVEARTKRFAEATQEL
jgi:beta-barrel assembly-enhancing protease